MKRITLFLLILMLTMIIAGCGDDEVDLGPDADSGAIPDLVGTYIVSGTDYLGNDYGGHLTIAAGANPGEYEFQWILIESVQTGFGVLDGNQLQVQWKSLDTSTEPYFGTVTYTVTAKGALYGSRTVDGQDGFGKESAYPNQ
jgi:hypothetical protein